MTIAEFFNRVGFRINEGDVRKVNNTIADIKSTATKLLGAIGIGFSLSQLNALAEEFNGINDKLNYALDYSEDMKDVQKEILDSANKCRMAYGSMVDTIVSLKQANSNVFPINEAATFVEYLNKLGKSAGYSDGEISSMQSSIQRVVAAGTMGAADITRMARTTPALIEKICEGLGVTRDELDKMAAAGRITGVTLKNAIMSAADSIDSAFDRLDYSISDAMLNIRNQWGYFVDDFNAATGLSQSIAKMMVSGFEKMLGVLNRVRNGVVWLGDKLGGMDKLLRLIAITAGVLFTALNFDKIIGGLTNIFKLLGKIRLDTLAIFAVAIMIALIVEDFINFMQGNDSIIGSLLEKAGIDTQKVRDTIIGAWNNIKNFLAAAWNSIKDSAQKVWDGLKAFWEKHGEQIKTAFTNIWSGIKNIVTTVWNTIKTLAEAIFNGLTAFWNTWGNTIIAVFTGIWEVAKTVFGAALDVLMDLFVAFSALFAGDWEGFWNNIVNALSSARGSMAEIFNSIRETVSNVFGSLVGIVKPPVNAIIDLINGLIDGLNGVNFDIPDWIPGIGGKTFGFSIPHVPALAEGGYLKANNPQLAIVGDNRTQGEIVAPEGKLMSIMTQALEAFVANKKSGIGDEPEGGNGVTMVLHALDALVAKMTPTKATEAMNMVTQNRSIVQNNVFNNEFNGDTPVQQKASKAMDKSAKDATSEMARALNFAR